MKESLYSAVIGKVGLEPTYLRFRGAPDEDCSTSPIELLTIKRDVGLAPTTFTLEE